MSASSTKWKAVWAVVSRGEQASWTRVGVAWRGENGAIIARLDAVPLSGEICIAEWGVPMDGAPDGDGSPPRRPEGFSSGVPAAAVVRVAATANGGCRCEARRGHGVRRAHDEEPLS